MAKTEAFTDAIYDAIEQVHGLDDGKQWTLDRAGKLGIKEHIQEMKKHYESSYREFETWLTELLQQKKPPAEIEAMHFALYETDDTISFYITGAEEWDEEGDWAFSKDYAPLSVEQYLPVFAPIYQILEDHLPAGLFLGTVLVISYVKEYVKLNAGLFPDGVILAAGFDGGDVIDFMELS
ncbi:hypothetical protein [Metabacillus sp. 84]|uniref:hypothetical protein n=1 Tax=unclassified Metabacillus TaxID=2675274 RepID=UPI003CF768C5